MYLNKDRSESERIIRGIDKLGFKAVILTVDTPVIGRREQEMRNMPPVGGDLVCSVFCEVFPSDVSLTKLVTQ